MPLKSNYLKLYASLLAVAVLVAVVCYGVVQSLNSVRHQAWLEALPEPLLTWLADHPEAAHGLLLTRQPGDWRITDGSALELNGIARERLDYGQVLAKPRGDGVRWLYRLEDGALLQVFVREPYRDLAETQARLLADLVEREQIAFDRATLSALGSRLGVEAESVTSLDQVPGQGVLERLSDNDFAFYRQGPGETAVVFVRLAGGTNSGQILKVTMPPPFDPWAWPTLVLLALIVATAIALVSYLMLSQLHQHLRNIENVAARIARGEMDARVRPGNLAVVARLGDAFNRMAAHIERLVGVQREMIHAVSHELRTPVARIRFGVQMIEDSDDAENRAKQLAGIDADIQELDELIDEILTYARLEEGGPILSFQGVDIAQTVEQVVREQQLTRPDLNIDARFNGDVARFSETDAEPRYLHRAIQNLVGNATRYARGQVRVVCHLDQDTCRVDVEDDGPGIPEADWEKVFTAFARLDDSRTRKSGGYGLGLSIVRRILYWHGGQAFVGRSDELGGARFSLVWPRRQPDGEHA